MGNDQSTDPCGSVVAASRQDIFDRNTGEPCEAKKNRAKRRFAEIGAETCDRSRRVKLWAEIESLDCADPLSSDLKPNLTDFEKRRLYSVSLNEDDTVRFVPVPADTDCEWQPIIQVAVPIGQSATNRKGGGTGSCLICIPDRMTTVIWPVQTHEHLDDANGKTAYIW